MKRLLIAALIATAAIPTVALGRQRATSTQHSRIVNAAVAGKVISKAQGPCVQVFVSTVDRSWATLGFPVKLSAHCQKLAANGVAVFHFRAGRWRLVADGSDFQPCPPKAVPKRVAKDLRLCG
jgi:hypothetical protein